MKSTRSHNMDVSGTLMQSHKGSLVVSGDSIAPNRYWRRRLKAEARKGKTKSK